MPRERQTDEHIAIKLPTVTRMSYNDAARLNALIHYTKFLEVHVVDNGKHIRISEVKPIGEGYYYICKVYGRTGRDAYIIKSADIPLLMYISEREIDTGANNAP